MFNQSRLQTVLAQYKKDFLEKHWEEEKYKWEAPFSSKGRESADIHEQLSSRDDYRLCQSGSGRSALYVHGFV